MIFGAPSLLTNGTAPQFRQTTTPTYQSATQLRIWLGDIIGEVLSKFATAEKEAHGIDGFLIIYDGRRVTIVVEEYIDAAAEGVAGRNFANCNQLIACLSKRPDPMPPTTDLRIYICNDSNPRETDH